MKGHDRIAEELLLPIADSYASTDDDRRRLREKIQARIAASAAASSVLSAQASAVPARSSLGRSLLKGLAASTIVALGAVVYRESTRDTERPAVALAPARPTAAVTSHEPPSHEPSVAVEMLPAAPPLPPPALPRAPSAQEGDALEKETQLLGAASRASREGDVARALGLLDEHARQFPHGVLAAERAVARITALCRLGRVDEARADAQRFAATHGPSPLARRVDASCAGSRSPAPEAP